MPTPNHPNQASTRVYRWRLRAVLFNFGRLVFLVPALVILLAGSSWLMHATGIMQTGQESSPLTGLLVLAIIGLALFAILWVFVGFPIVRFWRSYLKVSPEGLEFSYWPTYRIRAAWEDVERIGKHKVLGLIPYDALYLRAATPVGRQGMMKWRRRLRMSTQHFVLLNDFRGWPSGELAEHLRHHLPLLLGRSTHSTRAS